MVIFNSYVKLPEGIFLFFFLVKKIQPVACHVLQDETLQMAPAPPAEFSTEDRMLHETLEDFYWRNRQKKKREKNGMFFVRRRMGESSGNELDIMGQ